MTDRELLELLLEKVTNLEGGQNELKKEVSSLKHGQDELKADVKDLKITVNKINDRVEDMDGRNANNHVEIKTKLEEITNINQSLAEMYGEHEVAIRNLRRRPV